MKKNLNDFKRLLLTACCTLVLSCGWAITCSAVCNDTAKINKISLPCLVHDYFLNLFAKKIRAGPS